MIHTDNRNIIFDCKKDSSRSQRWKFSISEFNYKIEHTPGSENSGADYLSRCLITCETNQEDIVCPDYISNLQESLSATEKTNKYIIETGGIKLTSDEQNKIIIPEEKRKIFLKEIHNKFGHQGIQKLYLTLKPIFKIKRIKKTILDMIHECQPCQLNKKSSRVYGKSSGYIFAEKPSSISHPIYMAHSMAQNSKKKEKSI